MRLTIKLFLLICLIGLSSCLNSVDKPTKQEQLLKELQIIDAYLAKHNIVPSVDLSVVRMVIDTLGKGLPPKQTSKVKANYVGKFLDGSVFDEGTLDQTFTETIDGWKIAMSLMPQGTKATFYIPSAYGYGAMNVGKIPGNSTLVFYIDLAKVYLTQEEVNQLKKDTIKINAFIAANNIENVQTDSTGLKYIIKEKGSGNFATWFNKVKVEYTGSILSNGQLSSFESGLIEPNENTDSRVIGLIDGWKVGLQKLQKGGKATFYIPSGLAYGPTATTSLPANSILVFDVTLLDIIE